MGARAYRYLALHKPDPGLVIEVGADRGEGSTGWLFNYAQRHGLGFYTADIDPKIVLGADRIAPGRVRNVTGTQLLERIRRPVSVAYLDGFDWIPQGEENEAWIGSQRDRYAELGFALDNTKCQKEHMREAGLIARRATESCAVICDDTWATGSGWSGKGGLAVPLLEEEGFSVLDHDKPAGESLGYVVLRRA